jgi:hypothetical protein
MNGQKHYIMTMILNNKAIPVPVFKNELDNLSPWDCNKASIYGEKLFHGKHFQVIRDLEGISERGCSGILQKGTSLNKRDIMWKSDVAILDGGLQLAGLWMKEQTRYDSLPMGFGSLRLYKYSIYKTQIDCQLILKERRKSQTTWDLIYYDNKKEVVAEIKSLVMQNSIRPEFFKKEEL